MTRKARKKENIESNKKKKARLLKELEQYKEKHLDLAMLIFKADNSQFYLLDFLAFAAIHRSINLIKGFCDLVKKKNFICAAAILRLQTDNCLRFFAGFLVEDPHEFALNIMKGQHVRKQKDKNGKKMTDKYLAEKLSEIHPWISKLYKQASGYIHLSEKHIFNILSPKEERSAEITIGVGDAYVTDKDYVGLIIDFRAITNIFLEYMDGWQFTKDNAELVKFVEEKFKTKYGRIPDYKDMIKYDFKEKNKEK